LNAAESITIYEQYDKMSNMSAIGHMSI